MKKFLMTHNLSNLKVLATAGLFAALSLVCGKFLAFNIGDTIRFSFENLPIILCGMIFGPTVGALTGLAADIIGCILRGYAINPVLTLAAAFIGFSAGAIFNSFKRMNIHIRLIFSVLFCHIFGSIIIKTIGLCIWYSLPFYITLWQRIINYVIVAAAEIIILELLFKNNNFYKQIVSLTGAKNGL